MSHSSQRLNERKIVIATDVPFWLDRTGAQKRIRELTAYLAQSGFEVTVYFLGSLQPSTGLPTDITGQDAGQLLSAIIADTRIEFLSAVDDWVPQTLSEKIVWKYQCILHAITQSLRARNHPADHPRVDIASRRLPDFVSAPWKHRFQTRINDLKPAHVIVEYVTLAYLVPDRPHRQGVKYWIDTHDVLSKRYEEFKRRNESHWVALSHEEEAAAINQFDGVIAIQSDEAEIFRSMIRHNQPVVVAGYSGGSLRAESVSLRTNEREPDATNKVTVGFIASSNQANAHGIRWFLQHVWPAIQRQHRSVDDSNKPPDQAKDRVVQLILAGSICDQIPDHLTDATVIKLGHVQSVDQFYRQVQMVVNPVQFGTGLKIKNIEAIGHGKPLVISGHAAAGMMAETENCKPDIDTAQESKRSDLQPGGHEDKVPSVDRPSVPWIIAETANEMASAIVRLTENQTDRERLTTAARLYAENHLAPQRIYKELMDHITAPF